MSQNPFSGAKKDSQDHWISVSDMMTVLMMIFLLVSISYMFYASQEKERMEAIAAAHENLHEELYQALYEEFKGDLEQWDAEIIPETLIVRFNDLDVMFERGRSDLRPAFKEKLDDFFPRYIRILALPQFQNEIKEVRIEGHTSSEWAGAADRIEAYFNNMELSQERARTVLKYCLTKSEVKGHFEWLKRCSTANGMSSSRPITKEQMRSDKVIMVEDKYRSRRVEFRVLTRSGELLKEILERGGDVEASRFSGS